MKAPIASIKLSKIKAMRFLKGFLVKSLDNIITASKIKKIATIILSFPKIAIKKTKNKINVINNMLIFNSFLDIISLNIVSRFINVYTKKIRNKLISNL